MAKATLFSKDCPCGCDRRLKGKPCTDCCREYQGIKSFSEDHGWGECPNVGEPCGGSTSPSCSSKTIGPITLRSDSFPSECLTQFKPVAYVVLSADNFGMARGESGQVGCPPSNACTICYQAGEITPYIESAGNEKSKMYITADGQNSPHGGPYSLSVTAFFTLEPK